MPLGAINRQAQLKAGGSPLGMPRGTEGPGGGSTDGLWACSGVPVVFEHLHKPKLSFATAVSLCSAKSISSVPQSGSLLFWDCWLLVMNKDDFETLG